MKRLTLLAAALALGAAQAQDVPAAGEKITNQASVTFQYTPPGGTQVDGSSTSNQVSTTVLGAPSYTITPDTGATELTKASVAAGTNVSFTYTVTNTGNTNLRIVLSSEDTTGTTSPENVTITEANGTANDNILTLAPGDTATVTMTYKVPNPSTTYGQNLVGTAASNTDASSDGSYEDTTFTGARDDGNANVTTTINTDGISPDGPPTGPTDLPVDPDTGVDEPSDNDPNDGDGSGPGYTVPDGQSPGTGGAPVYVDPVTGGQTAYPKADAPDETGADTITLIGVVNNGTTETDSITVGQPALPTGATSVKLTKPDGTAYEPNEPAQDAAGNPIPGTSVTVNVDGSITFNDVPAGQSPAYGVQVTYPDTESAAAPTAPIVVNVPVSSVNGGGEPNPADQATFTIKTPGVDIRVEEEDGTDGTVNGDLGSQTVSSTTTTPVNFTTVVTNSGNYADVFEITNDASVQNLPAGATVAYYNGANKLTDTNGDGTPDTGLLAAKGNITITTRVTLPANAAAGEGYTVGTTATGALSDTFDSDAATFDVGVVDNGDGTPGGNDPTDPKNPDYTSNTLFPLKKTKSVDEVKPGGTISYTITGTNKFNLPVYNVVIQDPVDGATGYDNVFNYATLTSATAGTLPDAGAKLLYGTCNNTYSDFSAANFASATEICVAYDKDSSGTIDAADTLAPNASFSVTLEFTVKN